MGNGLWKDDKSDCCNSTIFAGTSRCSKCGGLCEPVVPIAIEHESLCRRIWNKITVG